eukprot:14322912-Ditylum_brightwellii.AAC.1
MVNDNAAADFYQLHNLYDDESVEVLNAVTFLKRNAIDVLELLDRKRSDDDSTSCASAYENDDEHYDETEFALQIPEVVYNPLVANVPVQNSPE